MKEVIYLFFGMTSISFTVSESRLFKPLWEWLKIKFSFLGELVSCGYCVGHWVAFVLVAIGRPRLFNFWWWLLDYFLTALVIAWLAAFQLVILCWLMEMTGK